MHGGWRNVALVLALIGCCCAGQGRAEFILIDDFESYTLGPINGQSDGSGTWVAGADDHVVLEANSTNQALDALGNDGANAYNDDPNVVIPDGSVGTVFFRVLKGGDDVIGHVVWGLSDVATPGAWGDYEAAVGDRSAGNGFAGGSLDARDGGTYTTLTEIGSNEWINLWMVTDNAADTIQVYAQSDVTFPTQTLLEDDGGNTTFAFRNGTTDPLVSFLVRTSTDHDTPYLLDDIYVDASGVNLVNPIPEPSTLALLALALVAMAATRNRRR
jgi:hypothetical protein